MSARKKILFIARWYPDRHDPMLGLFVQKHAQAVQLFHDVSVLYVTSDNTLPPGKVVTDETVFSGIREFRIYFGKQRGEFTNAFDYTKHYLNGIRLVEATVGLPDLVHVHVLTRAAIPALWLKITRGIPYLITEHWSRYLPENVARGAYRGRLRRWFTRFAVSRSEGVTTVTRNLANAMQRVGLQADYHIIPNVADTSEFRPAENRNHSGVKKLVHVSCFDEPAKNIRGIINVVSRLARTRDDFILQIVGNGKDYHEVEKHAEATGLLNHRIFFTGLLTGNRLSAIMREADANIMFSNYENLPCTIVESLCSGVPVISSDVGGISEHVTADFGKLVPPGNESALSEAVNYALDHPEQFNRPSMRTYSELHFSMEAIGRQFDHIYFPAFPTVQQHKK